MSSEFMGMKVIVDPLCPPGNIYFVPGSIVGATKDKLDKLLEDEPNIIKQIAVITGIGKSPLDRLSRSMFLLEEYAEKLGHAPTNSI